MCTRRSCSTQFQIHGNSTLHSRVVFVAAVVIVVVVTVVVKFQLTKNFYAFTLILWSDTINHIIEKLFVYAI